MIKLRETGVIKIKK